MDLGITGRVALVAGATGGIGHAVARALSAEGARVVLSGRRGDLAARQADELGSSTGADTLGVTLDLTDPDSISAAVEQSRRAFGAIDILVVNGGGPPPSTAVGLGPDTTGPASVLLLDGPLRLIGQCLPGMRDREWGRIVAIGSSAVQAPIPGLTTSAMYRSALASYLKLLSREVAADGVTVNMVLPGRIDTERVAQLDAGKADKQGVPATEVRRASEATIPTGRYGEPPEIAAAVTFFCGAPASFITGEQLRVDGGMVSGF
jgi:3-oxoacyl-[acyl-carrier protein] reductase